MSKFRKTSFNERWLLDSEYSSWLKPVEKDPFSAFCSLCKTTFCLSNMGKRAVRSHMAGVKHKRAVCSVSNIGVKAYFKLSVPCETEKVVAEPSTSSDKSASSCTIGSFQASTDATIQKSTPSCMKLSKMESFVVKDEITKAEIIWCINTVMQHFSLRGSENSVSLFSEMFPDSVIASKMQLHKTKIAYTILYGLAPYFRTKLYDMCNKCSHFVVGFDESLNKVTQKGQMDLTIRFWNEENSEVSTRYLGSVFLGHSTAVDLLNGFLSGLDQLDINKLLQVSLDGPNVNKKFIQDLKSFLAEEPGRPIILNIGSCGLHTLHNSFKAGIKAAGWDLVEFLRAVYYLFRHVPARRADYVRYTKTELFPMKYCAIRWLENFKVAERALQILPHIEKYVECASKEHTAPSCNSFKIVSRCIKDKLLKAKLAFFMSLAAALEPFLRKFQADIPLAPFLYESLLLVIRDTMVRFVKPEALASVQNITKIDLQKKENLLVAKSVNLGFATKAALNSARGVSDKDVLEFHMDCRNAMQALCSKMIEKSPLAYKLTKGISFLDPKIAMQPSIRDSRLSLTLSCLVENNWVSGVKADTIERQFKNVCSSPPFNTNLQEFSQNNCRLDELWMQMIKQTSPVPAELESFLKMLLILSHGNAALERGFSINKHILVENLLEESLIAQRLIFDAVTAAGGQQKVIISRSLIHSARNAHDRYSEALKKKVLALNDEDKTKKEKRKLALQVEELKQKKKKIMEEACRAVSAVEDEMKNLQK